MSNPLPVEQMASAKLGASAVAVGIADLTVAMRSRDADLRLRVDVATLPFVVPVDGHADTMIEVGWRDLDHMPVGKPLFDSGSIWQLYSADEFYQYRFAAPFSGWRAYKIARFNQDYSAGEILCDPRYIPPDRPVDPLEYPLDELLYVNLLAQGHGIIMHACGLATDERGYLFIGQSGAGKSTTARLWAAHREVEILSDERVAVSKRGDEFFMHGTPWHGEARLAMNASRRLTTLFFLRQWHTNEIVALSRIEAAARLFACCFPPFHSAAGLDFTLQFFDGIVSAIPAYELRFLADASAIKIVEQA
jgi:hypothetical protein